MEQLFGVFSYCQLFICKRPVHPNIPNTHMLHTNRFCHLCSCAVRFYLPRFWDILPSRVCSKPNVMEGGQRNFVCGALSNENFHLSLSMLLCIIYSNGSQPFLSTYPHHTCHVPNMFYLGWMLFITIKVFEWQKKWLLWDWHHTNFQLYSAVHVPPFHKYGYMFLIKSHLS